MAKISRPIVYVALLGAVAYAALVLTEQPPARKKAPTRKSASSAAAPQGFTAEDMKAHFPRYVRRGNDGFAPKVIGKKGVADARGSAVDASVASWTLTGITTVNGVPSALLEQAGSGETVFVKVGQVWNGLTVQAIEPGAVVFVDSKGKTIRLAFADPSEVRAVAPVVVNAGQPNALTAGLPAQPGPATIPAPAPGSATRTTR